MSASSWRCNDCGLINSALRRGCQACFSVHIPKNAAFVEKNDGQEIKDDPQTMTFEEDIEAKK